MNFFELGTRQDFASYWPSVCEGEIDDPRIPVDSRKREAVVGEYLGDPPRKPGKHGQLHKSAYAFFVRQDALQLVQTAARGAIVTSPTRMLGRESEAFHQIWLLNVVDCLDVAKTVASPSTNRKPGKIGVIRRPVFDESRWDGSDLFVVPQDPSYCYFCTENFVAQWKAAKLKGAMFSRYLMDPEGIRC